MRILRKVAGPLSLLALLVACQTSSPSSTAIPGRGSITIQVEPNPIVATKVSGDTYDFPFEVVVRETGGRPVTINRVSVTVFAPGGFAVHRENWDAERIRSMGYGTALAANGELRYRFAPRKAVPDERLFDGVTAELRVNAVDDSGTPTEATTNVTVRR